MSISLYKIACEFLNGDFGITPEGGLYITLVNKTGAASEKGTIVVASTSSDNSVDIAPAESHLPIGVIYEDGIADGSNVKVVVCGIAQVRLASGQTATRGYWCGVSTVAGKMSQSEDSPTAIGQNCAHIGHSLQTVQTAGSLALVVLHFN